MMMAKRRKAKGWIWRLLLSLLISLVLGLNLYRWSAGHLVGETLPMPFGVGASVVLTGSMEPTLQANDLVLLKRAQTIEVGDIVVYSSGGELVIHRVIDCRGDTVITQGDANNVPDDPITQADIKAVMIARVPVVGAVVRWLQDPVVVLLLLVIAAAGMELSYYRDRSAETERLEALREELRQLKGE